jgi:hypothetical protein
MSELPKNPSSPAPPIPEPDTSRLGSHHDSKAEKEAAGIAAGTLEDISKKKEHGRSERLRDHIGTCAIRSFNVEVWSIAYLRHRVGGFGADTEGSEAT